MSTRMRAGSLFASLWVAMTLAACARASIVETDGGAAVTTFFWAIVFGAGLWYAWKNDGTPPRKLTDGVAALGLLAFLIVMMTAGLAQGLMTLLLWLQAARNPAIRTRRDVYFTLALGTALVAFGATESHSSAFVLALGGYGLAALAAMVHCHQHAGHETQGAPAGKDVRTTVTLAHLAALCTAVVATAVAWYLVVPRPTPLQFGSVSGRTGEKYRNNRWEQEADGRLPKRRNALLPEPKMSTPQRSSPAGPAPGASGATSDAPSPSKALRANAPGDDADADAALDITQGSNDGDGPPANAIIMYVQADGPLYLRERTFDRFDDDRWTRAAAPTRKLKPMDGEFRLDASQGEEFRYVVQLVRPRKNSALALAPHAKRITAPASVIAVADDHAVYLPAPMEPGFRYAAVSVRPSMERRPVSLDPLGARNSYLQLPDNLSPRIRALADEVAGSAPSPLQKAVAIEAHLRSNYAYSFKTVFTSQGVTPLEDFLFTTRRGHCEFFASAMAVMLRAEGVPARVVNGVLAHSYNPVTGFFEVRAFDGHAWVEAFIPGHGWTTFEPTAAYPLPPREPAPATALEQLKEYTEQLARQDRLQGARTRMPTIAEVVAQVNEGWQALLLHARLLADAIAAWVRAHLPALGIASVLAATAAGLAIRHRATLRWWLARCLVRFARPHAVAIAAVRQLSRASPSAELRRGSGETVDEFIDRLARRRPDLSPELETLRTEFNASRYDGANAGAARKEIVEAFESTAGALT